ncbi:MAG: UDP-glucose 4-epimerase GalE [Desulfovibrio sp.]|nr:UDP-glucose 4-epimerase GalE [Desulfovibrio sp.]
MRILVTGGAGYIGSHACKLLERQGADVVVFDNLSTGREDFVKWGPLEKGDLRDVGRVREVLKKYRPDGVLHFAARTEIGKSMADPVSFYSNNIGGAVGLLQAMAAEKIANIVVSSSCAVYGQPEIVPISEETPLNPINPYGESKLFVEKMLRDAGRAYGLNWMSLRYFNAAGASPDGEIGEAHTPETHLIPRVIMAAMGGTGVGIYGDDYPTPDGTCVRDYVHVEDLARAHALGLGYLAAGGQSLAMNLGSGAGYSVREIIDGVASVAGAPVPATVRERRPGDPPRLVADASLAKNLLGWQAEKTLGDILTDAWNFSTKNRDLLAREELA